MSGTPKGKINVHLTTAVSARNANEAYVAFYNFMENLKAAGYVNRIALYYGSGGTGMDFWDGAAPPGSGSFAVYQFPPYGTRTWSWYFLVQYSHGAPFASGQGTPALIGDNAGATGLNLGFQAAVAFDSGGSSVSPWGGTTNNDGTDSKANPVWATPVGGTLAVLPRINNEGGTYATSMESCVQFINETTSTTDDTMHLHFMADRDSVFAFADITNNVTYRCFAVSPYTPATYLTVRSPLFMVFNSSIFTNVVSYGEKTYLGTYSGGAINQNDEACTVGVCTGDLNVGSEQSPNLQFGTTTYMLETPIVYSLESGKDNGMLGRGTGWYLVGNLAVNSTLNTYSYAVFSGSTTVNNGKMAVPWDGATASPAAAGSRSGIDF